MTDLHTLRTQGDEPIEIDDMDETPLKQQVHSLRY